MAQPINGNVHTALLEFAAREEVDILILGALGAVWSQRTVLCPFVAAQTAGGVLAYGQVCAAALLQHRQRLMCNRPAGDVHFLRQAGMHDRLAVPGNDLTISFLYVWRLHGFLAISSSPRCMSTPTHRHGAAQAAARAKARCTSWCSRAAWAAPATASRRAASAPASSSARRCAPCTLTRALHGLQSPHAAEAPVK